MKEAEREKKTVECFNHRAVLENWPMYLFPHEWRARGKQLMLGNGCHCEHFVGSLHASTQTSNTSFQNKERKICDGILKQC